MRNIIYVDGAVGVGKTTFIKILKDVLLGTFDVLNENKSKSHEGKVEVLKEPLHRDITSEIVKGLGRYKNLLEFLLVRKVVSIEKWSKDIAMDGLQELENNVLIVERSPEGDRLVREGFESEFQDLNVVYCGEKVYRIFLRSENNSDDGEQQRLAEMYENRVKVSPENCKILMRPRHISEYYRIAAEIVNELLKV